MTATQRGLPLRGRFSAHSITVERRQRLALPATASGGGRSPRAALAPSRYEPPQDIIDEQLVDVCDMGIALFANRLGTPTGNFPSGTASEIERLSDADKPVGVLWSRRRVDPSEIDLEQAQHLKEYLDKLSKNGLLKTYRKKYELAREVQTSSIERSQGSRDSQKLNSLKPSRRMYGPELNPRTNSQPTSQISSEPSEPGIWCSPIVETARHAISASNRAAYSRRTLADRNRERG